MGAFVGVSLLQNCKKAEVILISFDLIVETPFFAVIPKIMFCT
jgi:hypothetical protein